VSENLEKFRGAQIASGAPINQVVPGYGTQAVSQRQAAQEEAESQIREQHGMTPEEAGRELVARQAELKAGTRSLGQMTLSKNALGVAFNGLHKNADTLRAIAGGKPTKANEALAALGTMDLGRFKDLNEAQIWLEQRVNDPVTARYMVAIMAVASDYSRIMSGGAASIAQTPEGARVEALKQFPPGMNLAALESRIAVMEREAKGRMEGAEESIQRQREQITSPGARQSSGPKAGAVEDGYRFKGGDPADPKNWTKQ
jgi:hypothetical protein